MLDNLNSQGRPLLREYNIKKKQYIVTKYFTDGILKGMSYNDKTDVKYTLNKEYHGLGSPFIITKIEIVNS